jgi:HAD superfamily hydrolase (TIGR01509 family)
VTPSSGASTIEVLVVDLGGVAARFTPERRLRALSEATGLPEGDVQARIWDSGWEMRAELGEFEADEIVEVVRDILGHRVSAEDLVTAWSLAFDPDEAVLSRLAAVPLRRVVLTNNGPMIDACFAGPLRALAAAFDEVICSWHLRARKPDSASFEAAREHLGVVAGERLLLLDDSAPNVEAARRSGWRAEQVRSLEELEGALGRWGLG